MKKKEIKDKFIKLRVSETEREKWNAKAKAKGLTLSDYFRLLADEKPTNISPVQQVKRRNFTKADPELLRQVAWAGNNLNQIARAVNSGESLKVLEQLISIERKLKELTNAD